MQVLTAAQERARTRRAIGWLFVAAGGFFAFGYLITNWPGRDAPQVREGNDMVELSLTGDLKGLDNADSSSRELVKKALSSRRLPLPDFIKDISKMPDSGSPFKAGITLHQPVGTAVMDTQPILRWVTPPGDWICTVTVDDGEGHTLANEDARRSGLWRPQLDLPPDRTLRWTVVGRDPNGNRIASAKIGQFRVVNAETRQRLVSLRQQHGELHVVLAAEFANAGLIPEAQSEVAQLMQQNPNSPLIFKWMASLGGMRPVGSK